MCVTQILQIKFLCFLPVRNYIFSILFFKVYIQKVDFYDPQFEKIPIKGLLKINKVEF